jgi:hypothetical protein
VAVVYARGAVGELARFMQQHPQAGIAGSRLEDPDGITNYFAETAQSRQAPAGR